LPTIGFSRITAQWSAGAFRRRPEKPENVRLEQRVDERRDRRTLYGYDQASKHGKHEYDRKKPESLSLQEKLSHFPRDSNHDFPGFISGCSYPQGRMNGKH
jgi:hypothetical protein